MAYKKSLNPAEIEEVRSYIARIERLNAEEEAIKAAKREVYGEARRKDYDVPTLKRAVRWRAEDPAKRQAADEELELFVAAAETLPAGGVVENHVPSKDNTRAAREASRAPKSAPEKPAVSATAEPSEPREAAPARNAAASRPPSSAPPPASDVPDIPDEFKRPTDKPHHVNPQPVPPPDDDDTYALFSDDPPAVAAAE